MNKKESIDSLCIKLRKKTGSYLGSLESLSNEYSLLYPQDTIGNNMLKNFLRKLELGIDTKEDYIALDKQFSLDQKDL